MPGSPGGRGCGCVVCWNEHHAPLSHGAWLLCAYTECVRVMEQKSYNRNHHLPAIPILLSRQIGDFVPPGDVVLFLLLLS